MLLIKVCEYCSKPFPKPSYCSKKEWSKRRFCSILCKKQSQIGKPHPRKGTSYHPSRAKRLPCRICGGPTKYHGTSKNHLYGLVRCDQLTCKEASRQLKNKKIQAVLRANPSTPKGGWNYVPTINRDELVVAPFLEALGFIHQYKIITNGTRHTARFYKLDFGNPIKRLCIEIDGTSHRLPRKIEQDQRKDNFLTRIGWNILRIPAKEISISQEQVQAKIIKWLNTSS